MNIHLSILLIFHLAIHQEEEIKLKPVIAFDFGMNHFSVYGFHDFGLYFLIISMEMSCYSVFPWVYYGIVVDMISYLFDSGSYIF